jgi:hypothetical protein
MLCVMQSRAGKNKIPLQEYEEISKPFNTVAIDIASLPATEDKYQ